jgi:hypothetical protein
LLEYGRHSEIMMAPKPNIIFDTSALNALADDPEQRALVRGLNIGVRLRLSETNISEIVATGDPESRIRLLDLCKRLVHVGEAIKPYHWILEEMCREHAANPSHFDWRGVDIRFRELEEEIARRTFLGDPDLADPGVTTGR